VGEAISENGGLGSREAHHVSISPPKNCSGTAGAVGEGEGREKGEELIRTAASTV
jgi:hypothetical protein